MNKTITFHIISIIIFMFLNFNNVNSQNAYYDSYKISRILELAYDNNFKSLLITQEQINLKTDLETINSYLNEDGSIKSVLNPTIPQILIPVNSVYSKITGILSLSDVEITKIIKSYNDANDTLIRELDALKKSQKDLVNQFNSNGNIEKLKIEINVLKECDSTLFPLESNISETDFIKFNEKFKTLKEKIVNINISCNYSTDKAKEILEEIDMFINAWSPLNKNINQKEDDKKQNTTTITQYQSSINLKAEIINKNFSTDNEILNNLKTKNIAGQLFEASNTIPVELKNDIVTSKQNFSITEAALIQALSDVIISKFKESVVTAVMDDFIDINKKSFEYILFQNTIDYIETLKKKQKIALPVVLKGVKSNIFTDFDNLPETLFDPVVLKKFNIKEPELSYLKTLLSFTKILKDKKHPVEVLNIAELFIKNSNFQGGNDFKKYAMMTLILQKNLRDLSPDKDNVQIWLPSDKIITMVTNKRWTKLFFETIKSSLSDDEIKEGFTSLENNINNVNQIVDESKNIILNITLRLNKFEKTIESINKNIDEESIILFFDSFKDLITSYEQIRIFITPNSINSDTKKYLNLVENAIDLVKYISSKDYIHLIEVFSNIVAVNNFDNLIYFTDRIAMLDGIMNAKSSDELESAITSVVDKNGGFTKKTNTLFSLGINSYLGIFLGGENIGTNTPFSLKLNGQNDVNFGISVPIGLNLSYHIDKTTINLLLQIFDFTAPINYRFSDTSALPSAITFKQLISPGIFLMWNPSQKYPIGVGIGVQYMPELRQINQNPNENKSTIYGLYIAYDLPLFYIIK